LMFYCIDKVNFAVCDFRFIMFARIKSAKRLKPIDVAKDSIIRGSDPDGTTVQFIDDVIGRNSFSHLALLISYMVEINKIA